MRLVAGHNDHTAPLTCEATDLRCLIQLVAPANKQLVITEIGIGFSTVSPAIVKLAVQSDAGTATGALTIRRCNPAVTTPTVLATAAYYLTTAAVEPTNTYYLKSWRVHGNIIYCPPEADKFGGIVVPAAGRLGLVVYSSALQYADAYIEFEEV